MNKFNHNYTLYDKTPNSRFYSSDNNLARIDFVSDSCIRVALYKDGTYILPTFCVSPDNKLLSEGRDRLSLEGFSLCEPEIEENESGEVFTLPCKIKINLDLHNKVDFVFCLEQGLSRDVIALVYYLLLFLKLALFLSVGSRILFLIRRLVGVTSRSSSLSMNSMHCSSDMILGGTRRRASSEAEVLVLVRCLVLHTLTSTSSLFPLVPITIPEYTLSPVLMKS